MKKVLVIGYLGQLGSAIMQAQRHDEISIVGVDKTECDITKPELIKQTFEKYQPTHVINCAAYLDTVAAESNINKCFELNGQAVYNLTIECNNYDTELIQISSDFVFSGGKNTPFTEYDQPNPKNIYGISKLASEEIASKSKKYKVVRVSGLFGLTPNKTKGTFIHKILKMLKDGKDVKVYDHHTVTISYAEDVARSLLWLIKQSVSLSQNNIYHLVNEGSVSWYEFAKESASYHPGLIDSLFIRPESEEVSEKIIMKRSHYSA